jgi:hypothetical protein
MATRDDDVWREVLVLLAVTPELVAEALEAMAACDEAEQEEIGEAVLLDCAATLEMTDDPAAVFAFSPISTLLRRLGEGVDARSGLAARLRRFADTFTLLRDLDANHLLPPLASNRKDGSP